MKQHKDPEFARRIHLAKSKLGFHYGVLLRSKYPHYQRNHILNVIHNGTMDWEMLNAMEKVAGISHKKETI
jgi:hypothetical protein